MSRQTPDPARRRLLRRGGTTAAAGVAVAVLGPAGAAAPEAGAPAAPQPGGREQPRGYHETDRIRRYYELARF